MKKTDMRAKREDIKKRLLEYAAVLPPSERLPTVRSLTLELGCTTNMLKKCTDELLMEGVLYRKSRKEGTFLRGARQFTVGLVMMDPAYRGYVNMPWWLSGFCRAFDSGDFMLRLIQTAKLSELPELMRCFLLDAVAINCYTSKNALKCASFFSAGERKRVILNIFAPDPNDDPAIEGLGRTNIMRMDRGQYLREYVRGGAAAGCRSFAQLETPGPFADFFSDEVKKISLPWEPDRLIGGIPEISRKLPGVIEKYKIDGIHCGGGREEALAAVLKKNPRFKPLVFGYGYSWIRKKMADKFPWVRFHIIHEPFEEQLYRWGTECAEEAKRIAAGGKPFNTRDMRLKIISGKT